MKCIICQQDLKTFDNCKEQWRNGTRVIICKNEECDKEYRKKQRLKYKIK